MKYLRIGLTRTALHRVSQTAQVLSVKRSVLGVGAAEDVDHVKHPDPTKLVVLT